MNKITFLPRYQAEQYRPESGASLISIYDRSEARLEPGPGWADVLYLRFHDTDGRIMGLEQFTLEHAQQVCQFAESHKDLNELVVHCAMGRSRSAAVALFLAEKYHVPCFRGVTEPVPATWLNWPYFNRQVHTQLVLADLGVAVGG